MESKSIVQLRGHNTRLRDESERLRAALEKASRRFRAIRKLCLDSSPADEEAIRALREIEHINK